ncbi:MAG: hypothetical protein ACRELY_28755 [Polyangiaceae bacterium]
MAKPDFVLFGLSMLVVLPGCDSCSKENAGGAASVIDAGPPPAVKLDVSNPSPRAWTVNADNLPAIAVDGATVAILVQKEDGTRMYPNATLEIRPVADDKVTSSVAILEAGPIVTAEGAPDAFDTTLPAYKKVAQGKADEAAALLAKTKWMALEDKLASPPRGDAGAPALVEGGYVVQLRKTDKLALVVARSADKDFTAPVLNVDASAFAVPTRKPPTPQKGDPSCVFTPYIAETSLDSAHKVLVVRIAQAVQDNVWGCFEPSQWHVYRFTS